MPDIQPYGHDDNSFQSAGGEDGLQKLVEEFYSVMSSEPKASHIRQMHPEDLTESIDKLARFLSGWLGGPKRFREKYGSISIPKVHSHLVVLESERDAWLICMHRALASQPYTDSFKAYMLEQLFIPAERIRQTSKNAD